LADGARHAGAAIAYGSEVSKIDAEQGAVYLTDGRIITADVVVVADGADSLSDLVSLLTVSRHSIEDASVYRRQRKSRTGPVARVQLSRHDPD
jgi:glycine/D-amino acid oxidase-like deaminating enzyme